MAKRAARAAGVFCAVMALTFWVCLVLNNRCGTVRSGEEARLEEGQVYALTGYSHKEGEGYYFDLVLPAGAPDVALVCGALESEVRVEGRVVAPVLRYSKFFSVPLEREWFDPVTRTVRLMFPEGEHTEHERIYLATDQSAADAVAGYDMAFAFGLGAVSLLMIYGLSLYVNKRDETYLAWFAAYTGGLTLWSLASLMMEWGWGFVGPVSRHGYGWSIWLDIAICCKMFHIRLPGRWQKLLSVPGVLGCMAGWTVLESLLPSGYRDFYHYVLFLLSIAALVYACARRQSGAWLALAGHAVSQGLRLVVALAPLAFTKVSYPLRAMQYAKLFNLPFAFCCLFLINRLFAEKFTEAQQLSAALESANRSLEQKVEQRTQALREQQQQRNTFMTNVFHDLRTPLFVLQGCLARVREQPGCLGEELPVMQGRLEFMRRLVEDMFLMAKLEDRQVIFDTDRVPLAALVQRVAEGGEVQASQKQVSLTWQVRQDCTAWGDEARLEQAVQNLVSNAVYYTRPGGRVTVTLERRQSRGAILVEDTGIGIPPEEQRRIFERYYTVSGKHKHHSSGLGLSIAQEIVHQHGGEIQLESTPGQGSTFTVLLPITEK